MVSVSKICFAWSLMGFRLYKDWHYLRPFFFSLVFKSLYCILFIFFRNEKLVFCRIWKWRAPVYLRVLWHFVHVPWRLPTTAICPVIHYTYSVILTVVTRGLLHINTCKSICGTDLTFCLSRCAGNPNYTTTTTLHPERIKK